MTIEPEQIAALRELEHRLREAVAMTNVPSEVERFRALLEEVQERLNDAGEKTTKG